MAKLELGQKVTFKKYGADQAGVVSGVKTRTRTETTVTVEKPEPDVKDYSPTTVYRVDYQLKNGNEAREWMATTNFTPVGGVAGSNNAS